MADTLASVRTEVSYRLGDSTFQIWASAEIDSYVKRGYDEFCIRTGILWKRSNTGLDDVAAQATYSLPAELYEVERLSYKGYRIEPISRTQAMMLDPRFESTTGGVISYMLEGDGLRTLRKIRVPTINGTAGDTQAEFTRRGADLGSNNFELPHFMVKYVRFYAMARAMEREGKGQDTEAAEHYMGRFEQGVAMALDRKEAVQATRTRILGSNEGKRRGKPPRPVLPSNFPRN